MLTFLLIEEIKANKHIRFLGLFFKGNKKYGFRETTLPSVSGGVFVWRDSLCLGSSM